MKTYDHTERCPKCGGSMSVRRWLPNGPLLGDGRAPVDAEAGKIIAECRECGYRASRAPRDAGVPNDGRGAE